MKVKIINKNDKLPKYETSGASGMDIYSNLDETVVLKPFERKLIPTGVFIEMPEGIECQIRARSGLAVKKGIGLVNGVGTIDSDYRGEIKIPLINLGNEDVEITHGMRIAQMVFARYEKVEWVEVSKLEDTNRGVSGFGHTGEK